MSSLPQLLLTGLDVINESEDQVVHITSLNVFWTIVEVLLKTSVGLVSAETSILGLAPPGTWVLSTPHVEQVTSSVLDQIHEPSHLVLHTGRQVNIPAMNGKLSVVIFGCNVGGLHHVTAGITLALLPV